MLKKLGLLLLAIFAVAMLTPYLASVFSLALLAEVLYDASEVEFPREVTVEEAYELLPWEVVHLRKPR